VERGGLERRSPILMTAFTAGLALVPLALGGGETGNELQTPMAIVILGGLSSAMALNMVVLPAWYGWYAERSTPGAAKQGELVELGAVASAG
jgi:Cu/Ag efflux pump CusA